jgi:tRNA(Ile2) C34 agmatinyltransferase TiaS
VIALEQDPKETRVPIPSEILARVTQYLRRDVPICPTHNTAMKAYMTRGRVTYYACRCKQCPQRSKSITVIV